MPPTHHCSPSRHLLPDPGTPAPYDPLQLDLAASHRGYRAAAKIIDGLLEEARKQRPKRRSWKHAKRALYREGYYDGLVAAHCMMALGQSPHQPDNAAQIIRTLDYL